MIKLDASYGGSLNLLLERSGMSVTEFANRMGVTRQTVYHWKNSSSIMTFDAAEKAADILNCSLDELAGRIN